MRTSAADVERMKVHFHRLASEHGCMVTLCVGVRPRCHRGRITTWPIVDRLTYHVAMHELGHHATRSLATFVPAGLAHAEPAAVAARLLSEARAWEWALDTALVPPDDAAERRMLEAWTSHIVGVGGSVPGGGVELVAAEHRAEYAATWERCRRNWAWMP